LPIQTEYCHEINGEPICDECLQRDHRKHVSLFMD
jgi:hypothetical protein